MITSIPNSESLRVAFGVSSLGHVLVAAGPEGLAAVLLGDSPEAVAAELRARFPRACWEASRHRGFDEVMARVEDPHAPVRVPLAMRGTAFQQRVWRALMAIPAGQTCTYTELA